MGATHRPYSVQRHLVHLGEAWTDRTGVAQRCRFASYRGIQVKLRGALSW